MAYASARDTYFETQVLTATPQKLRWMAIDGAIRYLKQAEEHWRQERFYEGGEAVTACQRIVVELLSGLKPELAPELVTQVASLYAYVCRSLLEAQRDRDLKKLADMIAVLEIERETWRLVCEQLGAAPVAADEPPAAVPTPHLPAAAPGAGRAIATPAFAGGALRGYDADAGAAGFTASV